MKKDVPLIVFLMAIMIILYIYLTGRETKRGDDLNSAISAITNSIEEEIIDRIESSWAAEEPEYRE